MSGRRRLLTADQEELRPEERKWRARHDLEDFIRARVGDDHEYEASGHGPCRVCRLTEWVHHPGFSASGLRVQPYSSGYGPGFARDFLVYDQPFEDVIDTFE